MEGTAGGEMGTVLVQIGWRALEGQEWPFGSMLMVLFLVFAVEMKQNGERNQITFLFAYEANLWIHNLSIYLSIYYLSIYINGSRLFCCVRSSNIAVPLLVAVNPHKKKSNSTIMTAVFSVCVTESSHLGEISYESSHLI